MCIAYLPETRGATLEEINKAFEVSPWKAFLKKRRLSNAEPNTSIPMESIATATGTSVPSINEHGSSIQEIPLRQSSPNLNRVTQDTSAHSQTTPTVNDTFEMQVLNEGQYDRHHDRRAIGYENESLNEREIELWDTVQMPEVRYDDPWRDVYRLTNVHLAHQKR